MNIDRTLRSVVAVHASIPEDAFTATTLAAAVAAVLSGAAIIRAHDVKETRRAVKVADAIRCAVGDGVESHG